MNSEEGYVKYTAEHSFAEAFKPPHWEELSGARTKLHQLGLVGENSQGIGFGNVSLRLDGNEFLISGTCTGGPPVLGADKYCRIVSFDPEKNSVVSAGPVKPSAESMTHGAVYQSCPKANCVIHIHSRAVFDMMLQNNYPATPKEAEYGTPEIALAIGRCVQKLNEDEGQIVLPGHDEGVVAYSPSVERTLALILDLYQKAN